MDCSAESWQKVGIIPANNNTNVPQAVAPTGVQTGWRVIVFVVFSITLIHGHAIENGTFCTRTPFMRIFYSQKPNGGQYYVTSFETVNYK